MLSRFEKTLIGCIATPLFCVNELSVELSLLLQLCHILAIPVRIEGPAGGSTGGSDPT